MSQPFTLHCIPWQTRTRTLLELRSNACEMGLLSRSESVADRDDERFQHALVLSVCGKALGCARISPDGRAERVAVLPVENRIEIESALKLAALLARRVGLNEKRKTRKTRKLSA